MLLDIQKAIKSKQLLLPEGVEFAAKERVRYIGCGIDGTNKKPWVAFKDLKFFAEDFIFSIDVGFLSVDAKNDSRPEYSQFPIVDLGLTYQGFPDSDRSFQRFPGVAQDRPIQEGMSPKDWEEFSMAIREHAENAKNSKDSRVYILDGVATISPIKG